VKKYVIVAESGADLSLETREKYGIYIAQMHVEFDGLDHLDYSVSLDELTDYYKRTGKVPRTAGVNPYQYSEVYQRIKTEHPQAIVLHLCYSEQLSCSFQSAVIADDRTMKIYHIDTKNVSIGQGIIIIKRAYISGLGGKQNQRCNAVERPYKA